MKNFLLILLFFSAAAAFGQSKEAAMQNRRGVESAKGGQYSDALSHFNQSIELYDKTSAKSIHNIGWLYELTDDRDNALIFYEEALRRNPDQVHTLERAGFLHYRKHSYDRAILYGEKVMKLDPLNQEVIKWLPDAYAQMFKLKEQAITKNVEQKEQQKIIEQVKEQKEEAKKTRRYIVVTMDSTARITYDSKTKKASQTETNSYYSTVPYSFALDFTPTEKWDIRAQAGVPYWGALMPDVTWMREKLEVSYCQKNYFLGIGAMGNHYSGRTVYGDKKNLFDFKLGFIVGKYEERSRLEFICYPRMFPADNGSEGKQSMDVDAVDLSYAYSITDDFRLLGKASINDFYFFNNSTETSDYYGVYDFSLGVGIFDKPTSPFLLRIELTERVYLQNLKNPRPFSFGNGQGVFGLDAYHWFKGDPMSGVDTASTVISIYAQEQIFSHLFLYQKLSGEIVPPSRTKNDICFQLGIGGTY